MGASPVDEQIHREEHDGVYSHDDGPLREHLRQGTHQQGPCHGPQRGHHLESAVEPGTHGIGHIGLGSGGADGVGGDAQHPLDEERRGHQRYGQEEPQAADGINRGVGGQGGKELPFRRDANLVLDHAAHQPASYLEVGHDGVQRHRRHRPGGKALRVAAEKG